jgi:hypothetical protein
MDTLIFSQRLIVLRDMPPCSAISELLKPAAFISVMILTANFFRAIRSVVRCRFSSEFRLRSFLRWVSMAFGDFFRRQIRCSSGELRARHSLQAEESLKPEPKNSDGGFTFPHEVHFFGSSGCLRYAPLLFVIVFRFHSGLIPDLLSVTLQDSISRSFLK